MVDYLPMISVHLYFQEYNFANLTMHGHTEYKVLRNGKSTFVTFDDWHN